jgi:hypothetical protein
MWQRQSSPQHRGEVQGRGIHCGAGVHLCMEVWSEAGHVVAPEPTSTGRCGLKLQLT